MVQRSYLHEQDALRQQLGVKALQRKMRMDLDQQVAEKAKRQEYAVEEDKRYYENSLMELERWKEQEQLRQDEKQQRIVKEKIDRDAQLEYERKLKDEELQKKKDEEASLVEKIVNEMELEQRRYEKKKEQTKRTMRKVFEENMEDQRRRDIAKKEATEKEAETMKEYNRLLDEQEEQRAHELAARMERQSELMKKLQENVDTVKKGAGDNDAQRAALQAEEQDRHYFEAESVKQNRLQQPGNRRSTGAAARVAALAVVAGVTEDGGAHVGGDGATHAHGHRMGVEAQRGGAGKADDERGKREEMEKRWCLGGLGSLGGKEKDSLTSKAREALQPTKWPTVTPCNENGQTLEAERDVPKDAAAGPKAEENAENAENERVLFTCRDGLPLDYDAVSEETWREFDESLRRLEQAENYLRGMIKGLTMAEGGSERTKAAPLEKKIISRGLVENCPDLVRAPAVAAAGLAANRPFAPGERLVARRPFGEVNLGGAGAGSGSSGFNGLGTKPAYLLKQMEEKDSRKNEEKYLQQIQAAILERDAEEYNSVEKQKVIDRRVRNLEHRKDIERQMEYKARQSVPEMSEAEIQLNRPLLELVERTLQTRDEHVKMAKEMAKPIAEEDEEDV
ncbi:Reticulocyte-binding protein 2 homolog a [Durusdinium trenchii]|uniref:Reticulocyte-binding protein 2 homolog a n=1 Tax=Durusdinium trenchii TaxID=1381693 RepID=A0ABP0IRJ3_9DINO